MDPGLASMVVQQLIELDGRQAEAEAMAVQAGEVEGAGEGGISGQALANCLWGLAKPGRLSLTEGAADGVMGMVRRRLQLAKAGMSSTRQYQGASPSSMATTSALLFNPSELASVLYSFAKLQHRPPQV